MYREERELEELTKIETELRERVLLANNSFINLMNWDFLIFLGIITMPMFVFRGSYEDFLKYIDRDSTNIDNKRMLKDALQCLVKKNFIIYNDIGNDFFIAGVSSKVEKEIDIKEIVDTCKALAKERNKRNWTALLKTWLGVLFLDENQPYTIESVCAITGLPDYSIKESNKMLKRSIKYRLSKAYSHYEKCLKVTFDLGIVE